MNKKKRNRGKPQHQQAMRTHTVRFPRVGFVQLAPSRESTTPFCAYYGPKGEMCSNTTGLETVFTLPSSPPVKYMACPLHYDAVYQMVQTFLTNLEHLSKRV